MSGHEEIGAPMECVLTLDLSWERRWLARLWRAPRSERWAVAARWATDVEMVGIDGGTLTTNGAPVMTVP